jgi:hypothetical protein
MLAAQQCVLLAYKQVKERGVTAHIAPAILQYIEAASLHQ